MLKPASQNEISTQKVYDKPVPAGYLGNGSSDVPSSPLHWSVDQSSSSLSSNIVITVSEISEKHHKTKH